MLPTRDYRLIAFFAAIADAGSIRAAARRLGVSAPVVSMALADLEAGLGTTLAQRSARGLKLTRDGRTFHAAAAEMVRAGERAIGTVRDARRRPSGRLAITLPAELCATWLPSHLKAFEARFPEVQTTIEAIDTVVDLPRSDCDIALRSAFLQNPPGPVDSLAILPLALVAAPALAARTGTVGDALPLIGFSPREASTVITGVRADGAHLSLPCCTRITVNNGLLARELAKAGFGAALVIADVVADDLKHGRLARIMPAYGFGYVAIRLIMRDDHPSAAARAFAQFLSDRLGAKSKRSARLGGARHLRS
jgi:DNA-binding transcriptional LysR family regulator